MARRVRSRTGLGALIVLLAVFAYGRWGPMRPLFTAPTSTMLLDRDGDLLGALVAADGQWRIPPPDSLPQRYVQCVIAFEDRHFHSHVGVYPPALWRAWRQNWAAGRIVRGGSTITMQVARLAGGNAPRTYARKLQEILLALRLELRCDKDSILRLYAAHAPFGGNVVGIEAAAWRWFGRDPGSLSWAGHATLAVLPNAPAHLHPGRNRDALKAKRDRLLTYLWRTGAMDSLTWSLAVDEPLPEAPIPLPQRAPHLLATLHQQGQAGRRIHSTIDGALQDRTMAAMALVLAGSRANEVHNAAAMIMEVPTGAVRAYVGNLPGATAAEAVDVIQAPRSTGSLLKPFLHTAMLDAGELMPDQLVADIPTRFAGFAPRNFDHQFNGAVPAGTALARSLNVPAVRALQVHGIDRALRSMRAMGLDHLARSADHYGLSLVLGGAESTLWELTGAYASLARVLAAGSDPEARELIHPPLVMGSPPPSTRSPFTAGAVYHTMQALMRPDRPDMQAGWEHFTGSRQIAWKTGTSYGHRDAWAIGMDAQHAVGVWVGNASGEGRPGLTGTRAAAPVLFELFAQLPHSPGWAMPHDELVEIAVCRPSGHRAGPYCTPVDTLRIVERAVRTRTCPYHRTILVNAAGTHRVGPGPDAIPASWFVLPPAMAHYLDATNGIHPPLPPWLDSAVADDAVAVMEPVTPLVGSLILVPRLLDGQFGQVTLEAVHRDPHARMDWDMDGAWLGRTRGVHQLSVHLNDGEHRLTLTDEKGRALHIPFKVLRAR